MPKGSFDLKAWARIGAERRLEEIREEQRVIAATFPDLRVSGGPVSRREPRAAKTPTRRRRTLSAEARRRISLAQKRRWRKLKAAKS
jgi:hypothetical protein